MTETTLGLGAVNTLQQDDFVAAFGSTFEHSPWVAQGAWGARPFASIDALHGAMINMVRNAPRKTQIEFLRGHPELAGKEADAGTMTTESVGEQASAGLDALSRHEIDELRQLNQRYLKSHGFPFIIAVRRYSKTQIFDQLRRRIERDSDAELDEALAQIDTITRLRVQAKLAA
ncbi:2-oxo-4-hydroxy-4-carboxy-5-ureidoimidazoline decarboxylase [Polaromonas sp.]|uniref:2-oxo-4-hydroxy-4-carboxy-5-ureidoimidazoline decarboxylase n=1 Tax=Polaromonas sp. TaxID=1869339 RepID=UPI0013BC1B7B|nr:2-oxo-4-hydroxy-4-carboxy-5-ureidoimidazoline decarboxylase [Polaromonas sp.]NDP64231.1 2-oxo-4-hydroxy-4-carboxy-5-ureidoimidazoline decarboxylase [Polaromonas sp.]